VAYSEYRLPSKNAHSLSTVRGYLYVLITVLRFAEKIALINRFKLYLIKTHSKTPKNKKTKRKQQQRLHLVTVT